MSDTPYWYSTSKAPTDPYASEEETKALLVPDTRTQAERKLAQMMTERGCTEQGAEAYPILWKIAVELLAEQPAQQQSCYCLNCEELSKELAAIKKQPQIACCAECGKKDSDGWALYCVECMDKIHAILDSAEKKLDALIAKNTPTPSPKNHGDI